MILGQLKPSGTVLDDIYTVPADTKAVVRVIAANSGAATSIRVALAPAGAADSPEQYVVYDMQIDETPMCSAPVELGETDVVRVYSTSGDVAFQVNGIET